MSIFQSIKQNWEYYTDQIKIFLFGENNSRLDKIISRYYAMREDKRRNFRLMLIIGGLLFFVFIIGLYFYKIIELQKSLNSTNTAYVKIQEFKPAFLESQKDYLTISSQLSADNQESDLISVIQTAATQLNVRIDKISESGTVPVGFSTSTTNKNQFKKSKIDVQINGVSLKRITDFLNKIHSLPNKFILTKLEIDQMNDNKLYFNTSMTIEAYVPQTSSKG